MTASNHREVAPFWYDRLGREYRPGDIIVSARGGKGGPHLVFARVKAIYTTDKAGRPLVQVLDFNGVGTGQQAAHGLSLLPGDDPYWPGGDGPDGYWLANRAIPSVEVLVEIILQSDPGGNHNRSTERLLDRPTSILKVDVTEEQLLAAGNPVTPTDG